MGQAADKAPLLEGRDQAMDSGFGGEIQRLLHLVERRGDPCLLYAFVNEHQEFVLFSREHGRASLDPAARRNKSKTTSRVLRVFSIIVKRG
jgi:hypothetical protein